MGWDNNHLLFIVFLSIEIFIPLVEGSEMSFHNNSELALLIYCDELTSIFLRRIRYQEQLYLIGSLFMAFDFPED